MPADIVTGEDAESVAAYVASVAGAARSRGSREPTAAVARKAAHGRRGDLRRGRLRQLPHARRGRMRAGNIGPNLDESKPSKELVIDRVTNGKGAMPAVQGRQLSEADRAVADYVAENAGK